MMSDDEEGGHIGEDVDERASMLPELHKGDRSQRHQDGEEASNDLLSSATRTTGTTTTKASFRTRLLWTMTGSLVFFMGLVPLAMESQGATTETSKRDLSGPAAMSKPLRYTAEPQPFSSSSSSSSQPPPCSEATGQVFYDFFEKHKHGPVAHKWVNYFPAYERHFGRYRGKNLTFVEVGVQSGGSILMWKHFFGSGMQYVGIDINPQTQEFNSPEHGIEVSPYAKTSKRMESSTLPSIM